MWLGVMACGPSETAPPEMRGGGGESVALVTTGTTSSSTLLSLAWSAESDETGAALGKTAASVRDVNGDGFGDIAVGAPYAYAGFESTGFVSFHLGSATGIDPVSYVVPSEGLYLFGHAVGSAGDVDGDGFDDVFVGAWSSTDDSREGGVYVMYGSLGGLTTNGADLVQIAYLCAYAACGSAFGAAVAAGDFNADGFGDLVVGARDYASQEDEEGGIFFLAGSASGIGAVAQNPNAWDDSDIANAHLGEAVATGDINADGFADVVAGAPDFTGAVDGEGHARVYLGSPIGLVAPPVWTMESGQQDASFGYAVAMADVDGDGFDDLIVGAHRYDDGSNDEGAAFLFAGSAIGPSVTPAWTAYGDQADAFFGSSIAAAGDVNADGYEDVIIGARRFDGTEVNEGRAYVYLGSAVGLGPSPAWTVEPNVPSSELGWTVAAAGDVDDDGFDDVIVGAPFADNPEVDEGQVFLYRGSLGPDSDGDGVPDDVDVCVGDDASGDADGDGHCAFTAAAAVHDCDDSDAATFPGAYEVCDGNDNRCVGVVEAEELDADGDGHRSCDDDCDDGDPTLYPGAPQLCSGVDETCSGTVPADEADEDSDGILLCAGDCDDTHVGPCEDAEEGGCGCNGSGSWLVTFPWAPLIALGFARRPLRRPRDSTAF